MRQLKFGEGQLLGIRGEGETCLAVAESAPVDLHTLVGMRFA